MKKGTKVKMKDSFKQQCLKNESRDHILEFGECTGIVIGLTHPELPGIDDVAIRWQPSNLRYNYSPDDLDIVK